MEQPVPDVSRRDVERVVARDFGAEAAAAHEILAGYTVERETDRVHLAALKLANGNLATLGQHLSSANVDSRDLLAAAEYPAYMRTPWERVQAMPRSEVEAIYRTDFRQYTEWLEAE